MKVTLKDIAASLNMNASTVSRALRDDHRVKPETIVRVKRLASKLGYIPNLAARNLVEGRTKTILFLLGSYRNQIEQIPTERASICLRQRGWDLISALHHNEPGGMARHLQRFSQGLADGAIVVPGKEPDSAALSALPLHTFPVVTIDRAVEGWEVPIITNDNGLASRQLVQHCWQAGARHFLTLYGTENSSARSRQEAFEAEVKQVGGKMVTEKALQTLRSKVPLAVCGSCQAEIHRLTCELQPQVPAIMNDVFDVWNGSPFPAKHVFIAPQNFEAMAEAAVDVILAMLDGQAVPPKTVIPPLPIIFINEG